MLVHILLPSIILTLLTPLVFLLPNWVGERIGFSISTLLAISFYMPLLGLTLAKNYSMPLISMTLCVFYIVNTMLFESKTNNLVALGRIRFPNQLWGHPTGVVFASTSRPWSFVNQLCVSHSWMYELRPPPPNPENHFCASVEVANKHVPYVTNTEAKLH